MTRILKTQMHQRQTYETLLKDTSLNRKDKLALPARAATILRKTQQPTRYDDYEFLDLEKEVVMKNNSIVRRCTTLRIIASKMAESGIFLRERYESNKKMELKKEANRL